MPASRGKALPLLRTINAFLRFLPRTPADLVFRGRIHQFASSVIGIADKSAINMRGDFADIKTTWETEPEVIKKGSDAIEIEEAAVKPEGEGADSTTQAEGELEMPEVKIDPAEDGDVEMGEGETTPKREEEVKERTDATPEKEATATAPPMDFYNTLWSLQHYFASPPSLAGPSTPAKEGEEPSGPFEDFKRKSDFVLPKLFEQTQREKAMMGKEDVVGRKRKRTDADFFHPRYLTPRRLLEHEVSPRWRDASSANTSSPILRSAAKFSFNTLSSFNSFSISPPHLPPNRHTQVACRKTSSWKQRTSRGSSRRSVPSGTNFARCHKMVHGSTSWC